MSKPSQPLMALIGSLGLLLIAIAALFPIMSGGFPQSPLYKIIYTAGAVVCLVASLFTVVPKNESLRRRRWKKIENWSSIFFCVGAFFLWWPSGTPRDWLAFTLAGAVLRIIVFFATSRKK